MEPGQIFNSRYKIVKVLGKGGMSSVYLAENLKLGTFWAIKEIPKRPDSRVDFSAEPDILKKLSHPALPRIFDIIDQDDAVFIIVDYIEGTALDKELEKAGKFREDVVVDWAKQLCGVLEYLHAFSPRPVIYRDMKPSNIILTDSGRLKLIDFGIAREYKCDSEYDTVFIGTRGYAAPEQYGGGQSNVTTDIYSLGVTLYSLLTGKKPNEPPYEIKPVRMLDHTLSEEIQNIILKCTRQDPKDRFQSVRELMLELDRLDDAAGADAGGKTGFRCFPAKKPYKISRRFKKLVITVWDNPEFGCEFAYTAARLTGLSVFLADLDLMAPSADQYLGVDKYPENVISEGIFNNSGLSIVMNSIGRNALTAETLVNASVRRRELDNLFILTGNYSLDNYEYYEDSCLMKLIDKAYQSFDVTILLVNKSVYDSYTVLSLLRSDYNIAAVNADIKKLREFNGYIVFLSQKQQIPAGKTKFIAFEYDPGLNLDCRALNEVTDRNFIGSVRFSEKRIKYRNLKTPYAKRMEEQVLKDYRILLAFFGIMPGLSPLLMIKSTLSEVIAGLSDAFRKSSGFSRRRSPYNAGDKHSSQPTVY